MESLIFDVDGTLWDAVALVAEGWNDGLQSMGFAPALHGAEHPSAVRQDP